MKRAAIRLGPRMGVFLLSASALCASGCNDFSGYSTGENEAYCGSVTLGSETRTGFSPRVQMRLFLDATELASIHSPGRVSTFEATDDEGSAERLLDEAKLRVIEPMENDPLSRLDFGEGRSRNAMYAVSPADPAAESMLAVVSLRNDGTVEVRLVRAGRPVPEDEPPVEGQRPLFGIFPLTKQVGTCGF